LGAAVVTLFFLAMSNDDRGISSSSLFTSVTDNADSEEPCILNGDFSANPPESHWFSVQSDLEVIPKSGRNTLSATNRMDQMLSGMWQNIHPSDSCLEKGQWYEVRAKYDLIDQDTERKFRCDPTIIWNNNEESCPAISIRVGSHVQEVAWSVGPHRKTNDDDADVWNTLYGTFQVTKEMKAAPLSVFVARAPAHVDIVLDTISLKPITDDASNVVGVNDCSSLILNGDGETGDHRYWYIRGEGGTGGGTIQMGLGYHNVGYAFQHIGHRSDRWRGMLQKLNTDCLVTDSVWKITAVFRYFDEHGVYEVECDKYDPKAKHSCPVFQVDFFTMGDIEFVTSGPMMNENRHDFKVGGWNRLEHTLEVTAEMASYETAWIYINSVEPGFNYEIDDVKMIPM